MSTNLAETRLSLDGYRIQVLEKLKSFREPGKARDLFAEVDLVLNASGRSPPAQRTFWQALDTEFGIKSLMHLAVDVCGLPEERVSFDHSEDHSALLRPECILAPPGVVTPCHFE